MGCKRMDKERNYANIFFWVISMSTALTGVPRWEWLYRFCSQTTQEDGNFSGPMAHSHRAFHQQNEVQGRQMVTNRTINQWQTPATCLRTLSPKPQKKRQKFKKLTFLSRRCNTCWIKQPSAFFGYVNCKRENIKSLCACSGVKALQKKNRIYCKLHSPHFYHFQWQKD